MIGGNEELNMHVFNTDVALHEGIFPGVWELVDYPPIPIALLDRLKEIGIPLPARYEIAMSARDGNVFIIQRRPTDENNDRK
jgi:hypothetical protein